MNMRRNASSLPIQQVSDSELELMKIIWASHGTALYGEIMEVLAAAGSTWQKNTVITLLSRLVDKGLLKTNKIGRRNEYTAIVTEEAYQASQAKQLIGKLFEGHAGGLVSTLIQENLLTPDDYEDLRRMWENDRGNNE